VRLLVVVVVTVALLIAAVPLALTQAPRLHSPLLSVVAFGVAVIALVAGVALLVRATLLHRRARSPLAAARRSPLRAQVVPAPRAAPDEPLGDDAETEPRHRPERILLVPVAGRITVSAGASTTGPRHALVDLAEAGQSRQEGTTGQSPGGPSHTHAQQSADVGESASARSAAFARRYTATRSRR
jgi:hypothetical protein